MAKSSPRATLSTTHLDREGPSEGLDPKGGACEAPAFAVFPFLWSPFHRRRSIPALPFPSPSLFDQPSRLPQSASDPLTLRSTLSADLPCVRRAGCQLPSMVPAIAPHRRGITYRRIKGKRLPRHERRNAPARIQQPSRHPLLRVAHRLMEVRKRALPKWADQGLPLPRRRSTRR